MGEPLLLGLGWVRRKMEGPVVMGSTMSGSKGDIDLTDITFRPAMLVIL